MSPDDPAGPLPFVRIKVCGLTRVADALACAGAGADWIGLNFHPGSARRIDFDTAAEIVASLPPSAEAVGLFVDRPPGEVAEVAARLDLQIVQLHGEEPPEDLVALAPLAVIRAFRIGSADDLARMAAYLARAEALGASPFAVLVDAFVSGQAGGTGHSIASALLSQLPAHPRLILAGGLTPENVAARVAQVGPWMVDVASGVESAPGIKDPARVLAFVLAVRATSPKIST